MLILYPEILLNCFINSSRIFVDTFSFSISRIISRAYRKHFSIFFLIWRHFISFSCLISLSRIPSTPWIKVAGILVPNPRGKVFSFSPLNMMLFVGFSYGLHHVVDIFFQSTSVRQHVMYYVNWFLYFEPALHSCDNCAYSRCIILLISCWTC